MGKQPRKDLERSGKYPALHKQEYEFTPMNMRIAEVFMEIRDYPKLARLQPIRAPLGTRDQRKYCNYHQDYGHDTEDCMILYLEIEKLIMDGRLTRFLANRCQQQQPPSNQNNCGDETRDNQNQGRHERTLKRQGLHGEI